MKRLVSIITILFYMCSIYAVTLEHKTVLDIFGDPIKEKALTSTEPLEGKFSDSLHNEEPFNWNVSIDENGYVSFDITQNGIPVDMSQYYYLTIAFKVDDSQTPIECSAQVTKSDKFCYNRVVSEWPLIEHVVKAKTVKIVIYNSRCVYNLGTVDVTGIGDLFYDSESYNKALSLIENKEYEQAKDVLEAMDSESFDYFGCNSLIDKIDTALYLDPAEEKYAAGDYEEAKVLLDTLQRENHRVYFSDKTKSLIANLYFKEGIELLEQGLVDEGFKKIYSACQTNVDETQAVAMAEEVINCVENIIKAENDFSEINSIVIVSLIHEVNVPFYKTSILETYAHTLIDKGLPSNITTDNLTQLDTIRKYFEKEYNNLSDETRQFLLDTLYVKTTEVLFKEGQIDDVSNVLEEYQKYDEYNETKIKNVSNKIDRFYSKNKLRLSFGFEENMCFSLPKETVYIEGTYTDSDLGIDYRKFGIATEKTMVNIFAGISVPVTEHLFGGYRIGFAGNSFAFIEDGIRYNQVFVPYLSQHIELGSYLSDSPIFVKAFANYLISFIPNVGNSLCAGLALGIPYVELGFVMDNMKNPAVYLSAQFSFKLQK